MNAIDTIEDLIALLDRHPQWLEALRSRILTRDLVELPARFAELVEQLIALREELRRFIAATDSRFAANDGRFADIDRRFDAVDRRFDGVDRRFDGVDRRFDGVDRRFDGVDRRFDRLETKTDRMMDDLGILKGAHARNAAVEEASTIARDLGLRRTKTLTRDELWELTDQADTTAIDSADLRSFRRADLIMEATDEAGATCYVAVEISFTANGRDTKRALRNADFLTRFTGRNAYAVVAGLRRDDRIGDSIDAGAVFWHQLDPEIMEVE